MTSISFSRKFIFALFVLSSTLSAKAWCWEDPTGGKPFFPWLWEDQFRPTLAAAGQTKSLYILGTGSAATIVAHQYDTAVREKFVNYQLLTERQATVGAEMGKGFYSIAIALGQLAFDTPNGLLHSRALAMTSLNHITVALLAQRQRPNGTQKVSFPSGHTASMFATATALSYSYGPWVGVPLYAAGVYVAASRMSADMHYLSDTVFAATLGIFWGRNAALADANRIWQIQPVAINDGGVLYFSREF